MKNYKLTLFLLISMLGVSCGIWKDFIRKNFKTPTVNLKSVILKQITFEEVIFNTTISITNHNPYSIQTSRIRCSLFIDTTNKPLLITDITNPVKLKPKSGSDLSFDITLRYDSLPFSILKATNFRYRLKGEVSLDTIIGKVTFPFTYDGSAPVPRTPVIKLAALKVLNLSLHELKAEFQLSISVSNRNSFPLPLKEFNIDLNLNGRPIFSSNKKDSLHLEIPPVTTRTLHNSFIVDLSAIKDLISNLTSGKKMEFKLEGDYKIDSVNPPPLEYNFKEKGLTPVKQ